MQRLGWQRADGRLGGGYDYSARYDALDRAFDLETKRTRDKAVLFKQSRTFDGAGNVLTAQTVLLLR